LILNPGGKCRGRPPARVAGREEAKTRRLDRLPGETPGTDARNTVIEAEAVRPLCEVAFRQVAVKGVNRLFIKNTALCENVS